MPRPLTWRDLIYIEVADEMEERISDIRRLLLQDCRHYLARISAAQTGTTGLENLPSEVWLMGERYAAMHKGESD